ncbi:MAG: hypothetical protein ABSG90_02190 [Dehalococcoidia bacterium]|jgi:hypothetical protein
MNRLARAIDKTYINGGLPLLLMGFLWLGLWLFPWYQSFLQNPHWGHNYGESMAFLAVGLAFFNRRTFSWILAFLATILIVPISLEWLPHPDTAAISAVLIILIVIDIIVERNRKADLFAPSEQEAARLKKWLTCLSYIMLASLGLIYYLIRLPAGTYETDADVQAFDALLIPFVVILLIEALAGKEGRVWPSYLAFFFGMGIMDVLLIMQLDQPETWPVLAFTLVVTILGILVVIFARRPETSKA